MNWLLLVSLLHLPVWAGEADTTLTFRLYAQPATLDWNLCYATSQWLILDNIMEGMFRVDAQMKIQPALVKDWRQSADRRRYTFHLRRDVEWSDGRKLNSRDFVYSWRRLLTPSTASANATLLDAVDGAKEFNRGRLKDFARVGIRALDDWTVEVRLKQPVYNWHGVLAAVATFPLREDVVRAHPQDWWRAEHLVTLGAYRVMEEKAEQRIVLEANPHFHGPRGNVKRAVGLVVDNSQTATALFAAKKIDVASEVQAIDVKNYQGKPELRHYRSLAIEYLGFVVTKPGLDNPHVRRAIARAIDKSVFPKVLGEDLTATNRFVPPQMTGQTPAAALGLSFDEKAAREELRLSDWAQTTPLKLVVGATGDARSVAEALQFQIQTHLGLKVEIQMRELRAAHAARTHHENDLFLSAMGPDYADTDSYLTFFFDPSNYTLWHDEKFEELVRRGQGARTESEKWARDQEAEEHMLEEAPIVPLFFSASPVLVSDRLVHAEFAPWGVLHLADVELKP